MGREKTILLGFLGLLAGVFVGVLSLKLFVARPPTGTGPDIRPAVAAATAHERVEPPAPTPGGWDFAAAPPLVPDPPATAATAAAAATAPPVTDQPAAAPSPPHEEPPRFSRFAAPAPLDPPAPPADPGVTPASWQDAAAPASPAVRDPFVAPAAATRVVPVAGAYLVQAGDSWWDLADRAYGDGRLYRALFAWNRARDRRVSLTPGTRLDVPSRERLQSAWPRLVPAGPP